LYLTSLACFASSFDDAICILLEFMDKGWESAECMCEASAQQVQTSISRYESDEESSLQVANDLLAVANTVDADHKGIVPQTKEELKSIGVKEPVLSLLMQHAYASSELVLSLHTRKVIVALDLVDWEEFGAEVKTEVKLGKVTADKVKRSLRTWLPKGEGVHFHDTLDSIGSLISARTPGDWGKIERAISLHFSAKDKTELTRMTNSIHQFSKATRSSRGKKKTSAAVEDEDSD
jgi:endonuclease III